jgi:NADP-dependent 3-hydroxy acid dehydrogenase YdfG
VARREDKLEELRQEHPALVKIFAHDVTAHAEVPELFARIALELEGLDMVIYCAGVMPEVAPDEYNTVKDRAMLAVNDLGAIAWLNVAADRFGQVGHGTIIGIGSVAGDRGRAAQPVYNASKAFLHSYLESLRNRLSRKGVRVVTIKPGPVQTDLISHLKIPNAMSPAEAARRILKKRSKAGEHYLKFSHKVVFWVIRHLPSWLMRRLKI